LPVYFIYTDFNTVLLKTRVSVFLNTREIGTSSQNAICSTRMFSYAKHFS